jgi:hypothetical protein
MKITIEKEEELIEGDTINITIPFIVRDGKLIAYYEDWNSIQELAYKNVIDKQSVCKVSIIPTNKIFGK